MATVEREVENVELAEAEPRAARTRRALLGLLVLLGALALALPAAASAGTGELGGWSPEDLRAAYAIPFSGGAGQTVAIIAAGAYETAERDLNVYRERYGLGRANLRVVNGEGVEEPPAKTFLNGAAEAAADLDMVSAMCPECHLLLVQAQEETLPSLAAAAQEAVVLGADEVNNSYGFSEVECETLDCALYESDYEHFGVEETVSGGDSGFRKTGSPGISFPSSSPHVISVGGTILHYVGPPTPRGYTEEVWPGTGSGCSGWEEKPVWQGTTGCSHRVTNDVSAVAQGVSYYWGLWKLGEGTSVSAPIVAGILAHASWEVRALGAGAFYQRPHHTFDITVGSNGTCSNKLLCQAKEGYDGPSGWGTPDEVP